MIRGKRQKWSGAVALVALMLAPIASAGARPAKRKGVASAANAPGFGAFTPAAADPRIAAAFARSGLGTAAFNGNAFRYTPSGTSNNRRAVTVAVRARVVGRQEAAKALAMPNAGLAPTALSLGASIGWKRFALSGDLAKVEDGLLPIARESADLGLSFVGKRWSTKVDVAADRSLSDRPVLGIDQSWSVGIGGSYSVTRNLDVMGGLRYKAQYDQLLSQLDTRRDGQAVYLGTTFKF